MLNRLAVSAPDGASPLSGALDAGKTASATPSLGLAAMACFRATRCDAKDGVRKGKALPPRKSTRLARSNASVPVQAFAAWNRAVEGQQNFDPKPPKAALMDAPCSIWPIACSI
jgi:hypothetical protein